MKFQVRKANLSDAGLLTSMRLTMRRERETVVLSIPETRFGQITLDYFKSELQNPHFCTFIAYAGDEAAACASVLLQQHAPGYGNLTGREGYVFNVFTYPQWRHNGLATLLLDQIVIWCREHDCAAVALNASAAGRGVYLKYGFQEITGEMKMSLSGNK